MKMLKFQYSQTSPKSYKSSALALRKSSRSYAKTGLSIQWLTQLGQKWRIEGRFCFSPQQNRPMNGYRLIKGQFPKIRELRVVTLSLIYLQTGLRNGTTGGYFIWVRDRQLQKENLFSIEPLLCLFGIYRYISSKITALFSLNRLDTFQIACNIGKV